jgi:OMF family outer membrane factor
MRPLLVWLLLTAPLMAERMTLQQALATAETASPEVQRARLGVLENQALALVQKSALLPQLNASLGVTYQTSNLGSIGVNGMSFPRRVGPYRVFDTRPRLTQTVLDLSLLSDWRAAQARTRQRRQEAEVVAEQTRLAIVQVYLQALAAESRMRAAASRVETARALVAQVRDAEQAGTSSKLDVARATQQLETELSNSVLSKRDRDALVTMLKKTIGLDQAGDVELMDIAAAGDTVELERSELNALSEQGRALQHELRKAERERWPKVSAFGDYGVQGTDPAYALSTYAVGLNLTVPLWTSGRIENQVKAARSRLSQWEQEQRAQTLAIEQEKAEARLRRAAALEALGPASRASAAARETLELARLRYGAGLTTNVDVIQAQGNLAQAEEAEIGIRYESLLAAANLARANGDVLGFLRRP